MFRPQLNAPDEFEGDSNWVGKRTKSSFQQKKNHPIRSPYEKLVSVLSRVCLCSPNLNPERERLGLYLLLGQVSHVLDSDSDCTDIPDSKRTQVFHTDSKLGDSFFVGN